MNTFGVMANRAIDISSYDKLVTLFRAYGADFARVAKESHANGEKGFAYTTVKRGWEEGWPPSIRGGRGALTAIKDVVANDQTIARARATAEIVPEPAPRRYPSPPAPVALVAPSTALVDVAAARARLQEETALLHAQAAADSVRAIGEEIIMLRQGRQAATNSASLCVELLAGAKPLIDSARRQLEAQAEADTVSPGEALRLLDRLARIADRVASAAQKLVVTERTAAGDPSKVIEVRTVREHEGQGSAESRIYEFLEAMAQGRDPRAPAMIDVVAVPVPTEGTPPST